MSREGGLSQVIVAVPELNPPPRLANLAQGLVCDRKVIQLDLNQPTTDNLFALLLLGNARDLPDHTTGPSDVVSGALNGCRAVIDCSRSEDLHVRDALLLVAAAGAAAHSNGPAQAPLQVLVIVQGAKLEAARSGLVRLGAALARVNTVWWWARVGPLDTALFVQQSSSHTRLDHLARAAIVEVAGYDLSLAQLLVDEWDTSEPVLLALLAHYAEHRPGLAVCEAPVERSPSDRPNVADITSWANGGCESWGEGRVRRHVCSALTSDKQAVARALWRTQASYLLPRIDEQREQLIRWLDLLGHGSALEAWAQGRENFEGYVEIGDVHRYMRKNMRGRPQCELAEWLLTARNRLSHLVCLTQEFLQEGREIEARVRL